MDKATKKAIVAKHIPTGLFFSRQAGLTDNLFNAMSFEDEDNAEQIVFRGILRVKDPENYKFLLLVTTKEVIDHECLSQTAESACNASREGLEEDRGKQVRRV